MIKVENLSLNFNGRDIFKKVNLEIQKNKLTFLIGVNGSGKTTLFKIIAGNLKVKDLVIKNEFKKTFFLPQNISYPKGLTLYEYVSSIFYADSFKWFLSHNDKEKIENILELLELQDKKNILIEKLSAGELQKSNIAIALLSKADCLLLDEPVSNMDLINQKKVLNILKKLKENNITCVITIHDLNAAKIYGDCFLGIDCFQNIISLEKEKFFTKENLESIFNTTIDSKYLF